MAINHEYFFVRIKTDSVQAEEKNKSLDCLSSVKIAGDKFDFLETNLAID